MTTDAAMTELITLIKRAHALGTIGELLAWDEQVNLPPGGAEQRATQQAALAAAHHAAASDPRIGELLAALEGRQGLDLAGASTGQPPGRPDSDARPAVVPQLDDDQQAVVAQARRDYDRATKLPADFVREKAAQGSRGYHAWARARATDDFASYAPVLEKNLELARREAAYLGFGGAPYDCMLDKHDPGLTASVVDRLFGELKRELVPLVREITASPAAARAVAAAEKLCGFPLDGQRAFLREVTEAIGFDYSRGRIDVSLHPFCSGTGSDVRMTTRYKEHQPLDALFSSIHETGHGLYEQGLPAAHLGTALGIHAGMAVHESQSRLWENQVARSLGFWRCFEPRWRERFPAQTAGVNADELYLAVNAVEPTVIRVDADEVTYNLHIVLRFELEKQLFAGALAVRDLPAAWRAASRELLGLEPASDREGVLQDVHWSDGSFGYFPSYCLGNMIAAQLWYRVLALRPAIEEEFARGDFSWLLGWLRENVHAHGRRFSAMELVRRVTGDTLSPRPLVRYLRERYGGLDRE
ncbi:MAG: carboxypeptidase M32 [Verrucomicrobia bacterium]|nr:carboxypeptidase M32 [Verrucomicrobiota bacterium]